MREQSLPFQWERLRKALERWKYGLLVMAAGVLLLLLPTGGGGGDSQSGTEKTSAGQEEFDLENFEEKLSRALSQVAGAGETRVVLTLSGGSRRVLAQDTERGGDGGSASTTVTLGRGSGQQEVVALQTVAPQFRGALVVSAGAEDPAVRLRLIQAVAALTGLGSDRVSVCPGT